MIAKSPLTRSLNPDSRKNPGDCCRAAWPWCCCLHLESPVVSDAFDRAWCLQGSSFGFLSWGHGVFGLIRGFETFGSKAVGVSRSRIPGRWEFHVMVANLAQ